MQTFLPYADYAESARVLDRARLGKQRVETMQIMSTFNRTSGAWVNHPASQMWRRYAWALLQYQEAVCYEWSVVRGYKDTCLNKTRAIYNSLPTSVKNVGITPPWLGDVRLHDSHKSNLMLKKADHYGPHWPTMSPNLPYFWPGAFYGN